MKQTRVPPGRRAMVEPFPRPGQLVELAYRELDVAATGASAQLAVLGDPRDLPRPWDPATCRDPGLRRELWAWLETVVIWINTQQVWTPEALIPECWPEHPHLVHQIAVLADQRRAAGAAFTSHLLEEWHRYTLPGFTERMHQALRDCCGDGHQPWPARARHSRHVHAGPAMLRRQTMEADVNR